MTKHIGLGIGVIAFAAACGGAQSPQGDTVGNSTDDTAANEPIGNTVAIEATVWESDQGNLGGKGAALALDKGPMPTGPLSKALIKDIVGAHHAEIHTCYEKRVVEDMKLAGTTTAVFTIAPDGTVSAASASGFDAEVDACVAAVIKDMMTFPQPNDGASVEVTYPFVFKLAPLTPAP